MFKGENIYDAKGKALRRLRRNIQIIFQDPYSSLNPRMTVGDIVGEPFDIHPEVAPKGDRQRRVQELLDVVGLNPEHINRYPHQFSGGQRQRIGIARGLALRPEIIICDEPVSALDVSVQAQVVNLLEKLQDEFGLSYIFIAHDLSVVRHISDRVAVMYLGRFAELGTDVQIYERPAHPYTQALLSAVPVPDPAVGSAGADHPGRRSAQPGQSAERLPVSHALLEGDRQVCRGGARAGRPPGCRPRGRLPLRRDPRGCRRRPSLTGVPRRVGVVAEPLPDRRLLLVHAHPDDEAIGNGVTMARYAAEGACRARHLHARGRGRSPGA